jgi:hypothetical protein
MGNIENYKTRFNQLMESTMGNVKPLIMEGPGDDVTVDKLPQDFQTFVKQYGLTGTFNETGQSSTTGEYGYNKGNVHTGFNSSEIKTYEQHKGELQKCQKRDKKYFEIYNNLIKGTTTSNQDPKMAKVKADSLIDSLYPNMGFCDVVIKMNNVVTGK